MSGLASIILLALLSLPASAGPAEGDDVENPQPSDMAVLIECRGEVAQFRALAPALEDPLQAVARGWRPLPQANLFLTEFVLTAPITVFGHTTDHIAFSGESVLAIIDLPDPRPLARQLELETGIDTPSKVMFGKEVRTVELADPQTGETLIESMVLAVSNVDSHPGKALVGCSYSVDRVDPEPPEPVPAVDTVVP